MKASIFNTVKADEIRGISITGRLWFQRSYGNTYHSVKVEALVSPEVAKNLGANKYEVADDDVWIDLAYISDQYGGGRMFEQTSLELLINSVSDAPKEWKDLSYIFQAADVLDVPYCSDLYEVSRKKDL